MLRHLLLVLIVIAFALLYPQRHAYGGDVRSTDRSSAAGVVKPVINDNKMEENVTKNAAQSANTHSVSLENILVIETKYGPIYIELFKDAAPQHVARIKELASERFYDHVPFHRVIDGFMAQTGDPTGSGSGSSSKPNLKAEFNNTHHSRGIVSMARSSDINSANSQFFIMLGDSPHLDSNYTAFGRVIYGMESVDKIKKGDKMLNGVVESPDQMDRVRVASDLNEKELEVLRAALSSMVDYKQ